MTKDKNGGAKDSKTSSPSKTGGAAAGAKLTQEQRTSVRSSVKNVQTTNVNFAISIGAHVPRTVTFHPLPTEIITIYPDWRGYEFFRVRDQIIVVNPRTLEIVAILEV